MWKSACEKGHHTPETPGHLVALCYIPDCRSQVLGAPRVSLLEYLPAQAPLPVVTARGRQAQ